MSVFLFYGGPFSQWYPSPFAVGAERFCCAEQYMMLEKALTFGDVKVAGAVMTTQDPALQKALGKNVSGYDEATWDAKRYGVVLRANFAKFRQNEALRLELLATGNRVIAEASPTDRVWGIGLAEGSPAARDPKKWRGRNLLGEVLMQVRAELRRGR